MSNLWDYANDDQKAEIILLAAAADYNRTQACHDKKTPPTPALNSGTPANNIPYDQISDEQKAVNLLVEAAERLNLTRK